MTRLSFSLVALFIAGSAHAETLQLLDGRLSAEAPKGAKIEARSHDIMAAPEENASETRVVLDEGAERFVWMTQEMFALEPADLAAAVAKDLGTDGTTQPVTLAAPLHGIGSEPSHVTPTAEASWIYAVNVVQPDHTVEMLVFFVNPAGYKRVSHYRELARKIVASLRPGPRKLALAAGPRTLSDHLVVKLPERWVATEQPGPDFTVHHLRKLAPLGSEAPSVGVYVGGHANYQHKQGDVPDSEVTSTKGTLLGTSTSWYTWKNKERSYVVSEAIAPLGGHDVIHVWCGGANDAALVEARAVADSLARK